MKCFQIAGNDIISGLPVVSDSGRPYVLIGRKQLPLSNSLLESMIGSRIMNCSLEYAPGAYYKADVVPTLVPARPSRFNMVLVAYHRQVADLHSYVNGPLGAVVMVRDTISHASGSKFSHGEAVLARLLPGSEVEAFCTHWEKADRPAGWRGFFTGQQYKAVRDCESYLRMTSAGGLEFCA